MISVTVVSKRSGNPRKGERVCISFDGLFSGMTKSSYSDSDGEVNFNNDPGYGTIYVNGNNCFHGYISGNKVIYID